MKNSNKLSNENIKVIIRIRPKIESEYVENSNLISLIGNSIFITLKNSIKQYNIEYIGTRLHGGIRALQHGRRTMIIAVDGRAMEKKKDIHLPVVDRNTLDADQLHEIIEKPRKMEMKIHLKVKYLINVGKKFVMKY